MGREDLANLLGEMLVPMGFKRKGNNLVLNGDVITKIVNIQKSQFSNTFYINYGYILKALPLNGFKTHAEKRVGFSTPQENSRLNALLDLDSNVSDEERTRDLKKIFQDQIITVFQSINTESDLSEELKKRPQLDIIPAVKRYLQLLE